MGMGWPIHRLQATGYRKDFTILGWLIDWLLKGASLVHTMGWRWPLFPVALSRTPWSCKTTDMELVHRVACQYIPRAIRPQEPLLYFIYFYGIFVKIDDNLITPLHSQMHWHSETSSSGPLTCTMEQQHPLHCTLQSSSFVVRTYR